jgi:hypothetical protein
VVNNLFHDSGSFANGTYRSNGWFGSSQSQQKSGTGDVKGSDPKLNNDFSLALGSPLIDKGQDLGIKVDFFQKSRPSGGGYDIGAAEFGGTGTPQVEDHPITITPSPTDRVEPNGSEPSPNPTATVTPPTPLPTVRSNPTVEWSNVCQPYYKEMLGAGMGTKHNALGRQAIILQDFDRYTSVLAQVAGRFNRPDVLPRLAAFSVDGVRTETSEVYYSQTESSWDILQELSAGEEIEVVLDRIGSLEW